MDVGVVSKRKVRIEGDWKQMQSVVTTVSQMQQGQDEPNGVQHCRQYHHLSTDRKSPSSINQLFATI
jgi:hypothetical protein